MHSHGAQKMCVCVHNKHPVQEVELMDAECHLGLSEHKVMAQGLEPKTAGSRVCELL